jgi:hypothetical protein
VKFFWWKKEEEQEKKKGGRGCVSAEKRVSESHPVEESQGASETENNQ